MTESHPLPLDFDMPPMPEDQRQFHTQILDYGVYGPDSTAWVNYADLDPQVLEHAPRSNTPEPWLDRLYRRARDISRASVWGAPAWQDPEIEEGELPDLDDWEAPTEPGEWTTQDYNQWGSPPEGAGTWEQEEEHDWSFDPNGYSEAWGEPPAEGWDYQARADDSDYEEDDYVPER